MSSSVGRAKLDALTGLRYFAAMSVVVSHVAGDNELVRDTILGQLSTFGMPLFFTLSGFLMTYNYFEAFTAGRPGTLRQYCVARFARIYPSYLVALLISFSFMGNFFHDLQDRPRETLSCLVFAGTLTQSWAHLPVFEDYLHPRTVSQAYLGIAWSVSTEMFFYLSFPLLIPLLSRLRRPRTLLVTATGIYVLYALCDLWYFRGVENVWHVATSHSFARWLLYTSPYGRFGEFLLGCLTGRLFELSIAKESRFLPTSTHPVIPWLMGGCIALLFGFAHGVGIPLYLVNQLSPNIGLAPVCCVLIFCLARYRTTMGNVLGSRWLVGLGEVSYCLFLFHPLVQSLFAPRTQGEDKLTNGYILLYNHLAMLVVLHVLALGFYRAVEVPLREWIRRRLGPVSVRPVFHPVQSDDEADRLAA